MSEKSEKRSRRGGSLLVPVTGVTMLCLIAIVAQSAGLVSVVKYVTNREGWEAQKEQYSSVTSEWEAMSTSTKEKIDEQKKEMLSAEQERVSAEKELEMTLQKLSQSKGELESIQSAANSASALQKRAQSQEQSTLDNIQTLQRQIIDLSKQKNDLQLQMSSSKDALAEIDSRLIANQATLESQKREMLDSNQKLSQLDTSLKMTREGLRKTSDDLVNANMDLTAALTAKNDATAATESASVLKKEVQGLRSEQAKITGEIESLSTLKTKLEKDIATSDSRMDIAKGKLADYLEKWNNRDNLSREIDMLMDRLKNLKQTESDTVSNIAKLNDQSVKLDTKVKLLADEVKTSETQLNDLKKKQIELLAALMELQKLKKVTEEESSTNNKDEKGRSKPNE